MCVCVCVLYGFADEMDSGSDCEGSDKRSSVAGSSHKANEGSSSRGVGTSGRPTRSASKNVHYGEEVSDDEEG